MKVKIFSFKFKFRFILKTLQKRGKHFYESKEEQWTISSMTHTPVSHLNVVKSFLKEHSHFHTPPLSQDFLIAWPRQSGELGRELSECECDAVCL